MNIHYLSDLCFILNLTDAQGNAIGVPAFDWRARFFTQPRGRSFTASCIGGEYKNARETDDGHLQIVADRHRLEPGTLQCEFTSFIPEDAHPDSTHAAVTAVPLDITLVMTAEDTPATISASAALPVIAGGATPAVQQKSTYYRAKTITRGIIPINARPGRVYKNFGFVKLFHKAFKQNESGDAKIDLTAFRKTEFTLKDYSSAEIQRMEVVGNTLLLSYSGTIGDNVDIRAEINIHEGDYIYKNKNGIFAFFNGPIYPERIAKPPRIMESPFELGNTDGIAAYYRKLYGLNVEIQRKRNKKNTHKRRRKYWAPIYPDKPNCHMKKPQKTGLFRIRFKTRHNVSDWMVFYINARKQLYYL